MVSQFVSSHRVNLLSDLTFQFPEGTHAVGRLDSNSEGLLNSATTNKRVTRLLFQGETHHKRIYLVQVEKVVSEETLQQLRMGVVIRVRAAVIILRNLVKQNWLKNRRIFLRQATIHQNIKFTRG